MQDSASPAVLTQHPPEPSNLWMDAALRIVGRRDALWIDLRLGDLGGVLLANLGSARPSSTPPGTIYIPPVPAEEKSQVTEVATWARSIGSSVLEQIVVRGEPSPVSPHSEPLYDLLELSLSGDWDALKDLPPQCQILWPLLSGLSDDEEQVEQGLAALAALRPRAVIAVVPELSPATRRLLSERLGDLAFGSVFHGQRSDPRRFAAACRQAGLEFLPGREGRTAGRRPGDSLEQRAASELGLIADLWGDVYESESRAQEFYRAARWFEETSYDLRSLLRDGNLGVVPWMDPEIESVARELAEGAKRSELLQQTALAYSLGERADS